MTCLVYTIIGIANSEFDIKGTVHKTLHLAPKIFFLVCPFRATLKDSLYKLENKNQS